MTHKDQLDEAAGPRVGLIEIWHGLCNMGIVFWLLSPSRSRPKNPVRHAVTTSGYYTPQHTTSTTLSEGNAFKNCRDSGFVVRLRWRLISTVEVRAGESHISVAESNCVTMRWGGKQLEANDRSAGARTRFGGMVRRAFNEVVKPETHRSR
jgi:hypothetical protein